MTVEDLSVSFQSPDVSLLAKYEAWLNGEEVREKGRRNYLRVAMGVIGQIPDADRLSVEELRARIASLKLDEVHAIKDKVCWTKRSGGKVKQNTASTNCSCLNSFLEFVGCPNKVKVPHRVETAIVTLSHEECERLVLAAGQNRIPELAARNKAIVAFVLEGALRRGSFNVLMEDLNLEEGWVILRRTKNGDDYRVELASSAVEAINAYLLSSGTRKGRRSGPTPLHLDARVRPVRL